MGSVRGESTVLRKMDQQKPRFSELTKVRVIDPAYGDFEGFVLKSLWQDGWIYKVSLSETAEDDDTFDNWITESALEKIP